MKINEGDRAILRDVISVMRNANASIDQEIREIKEVLGNQTEQLNEQIESNEDRNVMDVLVSKKVDFQIQMRTKIYQLEKQYRTNSLVMAIIQEHL